MAVHQQAINLRLQSIIRRINVIFIIIFLFACKSHSENISIPGYERLIFNAGEMNQRVNFYNPDSNSCYFKMSLIIDGEKVIWSSDFVKPGSEIKNISLSEALKAGTYEAVLKYECFSLTDKTQLNVLNIKLKILSEVSKND